MLVGLLSGCGTMANGRGWGQDAALTPGWERAGRAAWNAAVAPETWVPAAGALAFRVGHADRNVSEWAVRNNPVFGSQERANNRSDDLLKAAGAIWFVSGAATPSGDTFEDWTVAKTKGFSVEAGGGVLTWGVVGYFKNATDRTRPNGRDQASFPSAHATGSSFFMTLASRHVEAYNWPGTATTASQIGLGAITIATSWARVEAGQHFPSDVLAGIAIGHFFGAFFTDAFLGLDNPRNAVVLIEPSREGVIAMVRLNF